MGSSSSTPHSVTVDIRDVQNIRLTEDALRSLQNYSNSAEETPKAQSISTPSPPTIPPSQSWQENLALKDIEESYKRRLSELETKNIGEYNEAVHEFTKTVERISAKFASGLPQPCCQQEQVKVSECYKANLKAPLLCAQLVDLYEKCVQDHRCALIEKSGS